jgi:hypothetical protein
VSQPFLPLAQYIYDLFYRWVYEPIYNSTLSDNIAAIYWRFNGLLDSIEIHVPEWIPWMLIHSTPSVVFQCSLGAVFALRSLGLGIKLISRDIRSEATAWSKYAKRTRKGIRISKAAISYFMASSKIMKLFLMVGFVSFICAGFSILSTILIRPL